MVRNSLYMALTLNLHHNQICPKYQQLSSNHFDLADVAIALGELIDCYLINEIDLYGGLYPNEFIDEDNDIHTLFNIGKRLMDDDLKEEDIGNIIEELYDHVLFELRKHEIKDWDLMVLEKNKEYQQEQANLPKNIQERRQKELQELNEKGMQMQQDAQQELERAWLSMLEPIAKKMDEAIKAVGQEGGYVYIFDLNSTNIPFVNETLSTDVTDAVKAKLGIK